MKHLDATIWFILPSSLARRGVFSFSYVIDTFTRQYLKVQLLRVGRKFVIGHIYSFIIMRKTKYCRPMCEITFLLLEKPSLSASVYVRYKFNWIRVNEFYECCWSLLFLLARQCTFHVFYVRSFRFHCISRLTRKYFLLFSFNSAKRWEKIEKNFFSKVIDKC